jgi:hypothetical protein
MIKTGKEIMKEYWRNNIPIQFLIDEQLKEILRISIPIKCCDPEVATDKQREEFYNRITELEQSLKGE